jgi:outer membrane protein insertion porin family
MQRPRARRAALTSGLALMMGSTALITPAIALAQASAQEGAVQRIIVVGNERIE